jgi:hypothetical protein
MGVAEVVAIAGAIIVALVGAVAMLYRDKRLSDDEHKRDLKKVIGGGGVRKGWPHSLDPPPTDEPPPLIIRGKPPRKPPR